MHTPAGPRTMWEVGCSPGVLTLWEVSGQMRSFMELNQRAPNSGNRETRMQGQELRLQYWAWLGDLGQVPQISEPPFPHL